MEDTSGLGAAMRHVRAAEAAHFEAVAALSDARALRLQILKDELAAIIAASPEARRAFELALIPGDTPRLWLDLITFVVMEPDPKTYRLVQHGQSGREVLLETAERAEMVQQAKLLLAQKVIRGTPRHTGRLTQGGKCGYSAVAIILAGVSGFALGALALLGGLTI
jgi:hypothetical protein